MEIIRQTNRTLLPDVVNSDQLDILTLIGDAKGIDRLDDDKMREINQYLKCSGYEEMERKFQPSVWSFFDANSQSVKYTLERPEKIPGSMLTPIYLNNYDSFFKTIITVMDSRKAQGLLNVEFHFEQLLEMISSGKVMEDINRMPCKWCNIDIFSNQ